MPPAGGIEEGSGGGPGQEDPSSMFGWGGGRQCATVDLAVGSHQRHERIGVGDYGSGGGTPTVPARRRQEAVEWRRQPATTVSIELDAIWEPS